MFTGLIEEVGTLKSLARGAGAKIVIVAPKVSVGAQLGDSISINGICLTITAISGHELSFDAVEETLTKSSLGKLTSGDPVNLERALPAGGRFGGHFVMGHVDSTGTIVRFDRRPGATILAIRAPEEVMRYVVPKGSIAIDGISLTVASASNDGFEIALIPHTIESTNLVAKRPGDLVNLEADIIGKYLEKFVTARSGSRGVTEQLLVDAGWIEE